MISTLLLLLGMAFFTLALFVEEFVNWPDTKGD